MFRTLLVCLALLPDLGRPQGVEHTFRPSGGPAQGAEHPGGRLSGNEKLVFERGKSPYLLRGDIVVEKDAELIVEPGVEVRVEPQVGITVRGVLTAVGTESERITFTTVEQPSARISFPEVRLVDGPTILSGRLQLRHNGAWRSVCTNSKNWTLADMETACRQLGFQGGSFFQWFDRQMPLRPRLLYETPRCYGTEPNLQQCEWTTKQLGSGVCDYHPDLGIACHARHDRSIPFWRGIRFEHAKAHEILTSDNTLYVPTSYSRLHHVSVRYAGSGRDLNTTSALEIEGVPPLMQNLEVVNSAYNGINITNAKCPITINNCTVRNNRGYGVFINSTYGLARVEGCTISNNGADGVRYVHAEERPDEKIDRLGFNDFCKSALQSSQTFPVNLFMEQTIFLHTLKTCSKVFTTRQRFTITLNILRAVTDRNDTATIQVYDGNDYNHRLIAEFPIRNNTRPQAITSTTNQLFIRFEAQPKTNIVLFMRLLSTKLKSYDLNVTNSDVSENRGRGIAVDNLRSQLHIHRTNVTNNQHVAGVHVTSGVGDVNVTESLIASNMGDGINVTYTGGSRNVSRSRISSNQGYGIAIWLNQTEETEFIFVNQTSVVEYSHISKNFDTGLFHGNFCGPALFNFSANAFNYAEGDALEFLTCWLKTNVSTKLIIANNEFMGNKRIGLRITPALNLNARITYNHFRNGVFGALLIKNQALEQFNELPTRIRVIQNYFRENRGVYVANFALSPYAQNQYLLFHRNFVQHNMISEPFQPEDNSKSSLNPRSRVAAPIVVGSANVDIFRNVLENPESLYEIGSHLDDQSKVINCTYNWLGFGEEKKIFHRLFHRYNRYNLAKLTYIPYLLHSTNPMTTKIITLSQYVPVFASLPSNEIGGEVEGEEVLRKGEYTVNQDVNIRPGGKLTLEAGVTLKFASSVGMMVGGRLEARGTGPDSIKFTLKEEISFEPANETYETQTGNPEFEMIELSTISPSIHNSFLRLLGGISDTEGRLQVKVNGEWGTVCNYGWTIENAALVCQQLGYVLNPDDWYMERNQIPEAGTNEDVVLSNVRCDDFDMDITKCKAERKGDFENSCGHENDVGMRCYPTSWAGVRFGALAETSDIQFVTIEKSGLLDYATSTFKPALQLDFARHNFENIRVSNNFHHGLGVMYAHLFTDERVNEIRNSEFSNNKGAGIAMKQLSFTVYNSQIENNAMGIKHDPVLTGLQQRELAGWFQISDEMPYYRPIQVPQDSDYNRIQLRNGETKYLITKKVSGDNQERSYKISCDPQWVIGIQLLNPIENRSTENILIHDSLSSNRKSAIWNLRRDLTVFPTTSSTYGIILEYSSGDDAYGGAVLVLSTIRAPIQNVYNRIVKGPVPTLTAKNTRIRNNQYGLHASFYNRYLNEQGDHFLRKANETFKFLNCDISHNLKEAFFVHSPHWDLHRSNISEIVIMVNSSSITDNAKGFYHFSRDMRSSNNLFHYVLQDVTIERNQAGGFDVNLPYVWQYNENFTHSVYMDNNTWAKNRHFKFNVDGHFAVVNITRNLFSENQCASGLVSIGGMEKKMRIMHNKFNNNQGNFVLEFLTNSQSEIIGEVPAKFMFNELRNNIQSITPTRSFGVLQLQNEPTAVVAFRGIQKVQVIRNLFSGNQLTYELVAGIKTAKTNNTLNCQENWWGSRDDGDISRKIFDFDDWNNHAIATFRPFLLDDNFRSDITVSFAPNVSIDLDNLGGRLTSDLVLRNRGFPYIVQSDITVMPKVTLTIEPGVVLEFAPNVGILVLGRLKATGYQNDEIIMRPIKKTAPLTSHRMIKRQLEHFYSADNIRLCKGVGCLDSDEKTPNQGFLEYFNQTTLQWIPMCDSRFTERNAQVVCRQLGFDPINSFFAHDIRIEFHSNSLSRIWSWPEPLQCKGTEKKYEECPIRLNGQQFGHRHSCKWNSNFVFIHCGQRNLEKGKDYWGGIRFANHQFEQQLYTHRLHDIHTHSNQHAEESSLEYVKIIGAGVLHNEKSPAVQSITKSPRINSISVSRSGSHGINLISPTATMNLLYNTVEDSLGVGVNILSLTGEGQDSGQSSFTPLKNINIPYNLFGLVDICDTQKEIRIEERILLYYKYDNHPVNCIKIFKSTYNDKPLGFRLLQVNLFNSSNHQYGIPDFISLHDGDIFNVTSTIIDRITTSTGNERQLFTTVLPSMSVKLFANGASSNHGFIAEIVTLPITTIRFDRDVQHNITHSILNRNREGGLVYASSGEDSPIITMDRNQFQDNCEKLYGNFTTCEAAIDMDIQNTRTIYFRNNLVNRNQGGLAIRVDSRGSTTSLKGFIHNNLFVNNTNLPVLYVEGRQSAPYQEIIIYRNYFTRNFARYHNNIVLKQVISNFTYNYVKRNVGLQNYEVSGFDKVRLKVAQSTTHNGFYHNNAVHRDSRSTIVAGTAAQQYTDNIFFNPDNDYEMITVNRSRFEFNSTLQLWNTTIDAIYNYWGLNNSLAVGGRIKDQRDDHRLLEVNYEPYYMNNQSVLLNKKCPPGWDLVGGTCYIYIGAPMTFHEANAFCQADNASMPRLLSNYDYADLHEFLRSQQEWFLYSEKVWVRHIDRFDDCTMFAYGRIESAECLQRNPFICEIDTKLSIQIQPIADDVITIAVFSSLAVAVLLIIVFIVCWWSKSKYRQTQRLERRNSIRASLHSLRSVGLAPGSFADASYRRKAAQLSSRSTDTLTKNSDFRSKMITTDGSFESMEKSAYTADDALSYDTFPSIEYHRSPTKFENQYARPSQTSSFELAYKNEGFRDNSSNSNFQSRAESAQEDEPIMEQSYPPSEYYTTDTLPLNTTFGKSDSTLNMKRGVQEANRKPKYDPIYSRERPNAGLLSELRTKLGDGEPPPPPDPPVSPDYHTVGLAGPDFEEGAPKPRLRAKSEVLLETNFDYTPPGGASPDFNPISEYNRSKSQPLETAM